MTPLIAGLMEVNQLSKAGQQLLPDQDGRQACKLIDTVTSLGLLACMVFGGVALLKNDGADKKKG